MFFVMGVVSMAWVPRIPEIKEANGLSDSQFGLVLVSSSVGAVLAAQLAGRLIKLIRAVNRLLTKTDKQRIQGLHHCIAIAVCDVLV